MKSNDTPYLYKKPNAMNEARIAVARLTTAIDRAGEAERMLNAAGYRAAAHGVHQAGLRLESWREKARAAIARRDAFTRKESK